MQYRSPSESKKTNSLQTPKDSVKFNSDLDLYTQTKDEIISPIIASTSSDSLSTAKQENKTVKFKTWKKLLLPINGKNDKETSNKSSSPNTKSRYKKFFNRYSKKAVVS